jgi:hypothetical protein
MKNKLYEEMYHQYLNGYSLSEVGKMYGVTRQSVYSGFKCREYALRKKKELPFQTFNGIKFTLRNTGYYSRTDDDRVLMHRYVWEYYNGNINEGYDLHHINHDKSDNRIENLEIYSKVEHARKFNTGSNQYAKKSLRETN